MMGQQDRKEPLFYYFRLEDQIPETHLLRLIDRHVDFSFVRTRLQRFSGGRPSPDRGRHPRASQCEPAPPRGSRPARRDQRVGATRQFRGGFRPKD
jgi:hypothetical protein